ncbi:MAG: hypothetical protein JKY37_27710, partial [Nannocystaceae bacterium]|nr:hypothetical protein [Nannocystaceae bacterium]
GGTSTGAADSTGTPVGDTSTGSSTGNGSTGPSCGAASGTCDTLDILFVVDNSGSMSDEFSVLIPAISNINALLGPIVADLCSYHIGVTTTEPAPDFQPKACQVRGALSRSGALAGKNGCFPNDPDHPAFLTEEDPPAVLGCLMTVGQNNDDDEKQLDTVFAALGPELAEPGACNEGFLREGVPLLIVILTDEDDDVDSKTEDASRTGSAEGPSAWYDALTAIKPASELGVVIVAAETKNGDCDPWVFLGGSSDGEGAEDATRLRTMLAYFTGSGYDDHTAKIDICGSVEALQEGFLQFSLVLDAVCADADGP